MKDYKKKQQDKQAELCHICCGEETGGKYILSDVGTIYSMALEKK